MEGFPYEHGREGMGKQTRQPAQPAVRARGQGLSRRALQGTRSPRSTASLSVGQGDPTRGRQQRSAAAGGKTIHVDCGCGCKACINRQTVFGSVWWCEMALSGRQWHQTANNASLLLVEATDKQGKGDRSRVWAPCGGSGCRFVAGLRISNTSVTDRARGRPAGQLSSARCSLSVPGARSRVWPLSYPTLERFSIDNRQWAIES